MWDYRWTCLFLCLYGLLTKFRPSEQFVTEYLIESKNFSSNTIVQSIYPISTYSNLASLPLIFLVTDFLRYRSVLVFGALVLVLTWILLISSQSLIQLQIVQILYGLSSSTEIAYFTYIYALVDRERYKKVTSYTRGAILFGSFLSGVFAQVFTTYDLLNYSELNYISLGSLILALFITFFLPTVQESLYFYKKPSSEVPNELNSDLSLKNRIRRAHKVLWDDFKGAYSNAYVLKWSVWWAFASAIQFQVSNYIQPLWEDIMPYTNGLIFNGGIGATHTLLSALLTIGLAYIAINWRKWGELFLSVLSLFQGIILIIIAQTNAISIGYAGYILYKILFQILITIASSEISQGINRDSHALIFGFNTFIALIIQTILTIAVTDSRGWALTTRSQFTIYGIGCISLWILFTTSFVYSLCKKRK